MSTTALETLLNAVAAGETPVAAALAQLKRFPVDPVTSSDGEVIGRLDTHRKLRHGFPEVILAQGKRYGHLKRIVGQALIHGEDLLITRLSDKRRRKLMKRFPELKSAGQSRCLYRRMATRHRKKERVGEGLVGVICAGTADVPVAQEAALTARLMGARVETWFDAGVAGLHRLLAAEKLLAEARVFVVVAGMEGALPSVVGGLVDRPVIAVPVSSGYGLALGGIAAALGMLNSCAANVTVVNVDNGFGAGYVAGLINRTPRDHPGG